MRNSTGSKEQKTAFFTNAELVTQLATMDVPFVWGNTQEQPTAKIDYSQLIAALAHSSEARLRLALIPFFLRHPDSAQDAKFVAGQLTGQALLVLQCYYTAAHFLQQKYRSRLDACLGPTGSLPDLFTTRLGLFAFDTPNEGLQALADRQAILTGRATNWLGTYEHGAQRFIRYYEKRQRWQLSPYSKSMPY